MSKSIQLEILTPCFCRGAHKAQPEIRTSSIRGQLRWWYRALYGTGVGEWELFGGVNGLRLGLERDAVASQVRLWVFNKSGAIDHHALPLPHKPFKSPALVDGRFSLGWEFRPEATEDQKTAFERTLKAWAMLGGLGFRANRAAGSMWPLELRPKIEHFEKAVKNLALPSHLTVHVLGTGSQGPDALRRIACDTVKTQSGTYEANVLGGVWGNERLASALKLKVARFEEGSRLVAVCDRRLDRGAHYFGDAINALGTKPLGPLLRQASIG